MKYNPKVNEEAAALPGFTERPSAAARRTRSRAAWRCSYLAEKLLCEITGMDAHDLPARGGRARRVYRTAADQGLSSVHRDDAKRTKIIVPDSAHGTNPASRHHGGLHGGQHALQRRTAAWTWKPLQGRRWVPTRQASCSPTPTRWAYLTKIFWRSRSIVHEAGGLCYYDGANLNAVMGIARPGDMGFDVVHLNLHKTFSTPHGGGGPGSGPVGCKEFLRRLPARRPRARRRTEATATSDRRGTHHWHV